MRINAPLGGFENQNVVICQLRLRWNDFVAIIDRRSGCARNFDVAGVIS